MSETYYMCGVIINYCHHIASDPLLARVVDRGKRLSDAGDLSLDEHYDG